MGLRGVTPYAEIEGAQPSYAIAVKKAKQSFARSYAFGINALRRKLNANYRLLLERAIFAKALPLHSARDNVP